MRHEPDDVVVHQIGPRTVASLHQTGSFDQIPATVERLVRWLSERGLETSGPPGMRSLRDPRTVSEDAQAWEAFVELRPSVSADDVVPSADDEVEIRSLPATEVRMPVTRRG